MDNKKEILVLSENQNDEESSKLYKISNEEKLLYATEEVYIEKSNSQISHSPASYINKKYINKKSILGSIFIVILVIIIRLNWGQLFFFI